MGREKEWKGALGGEVTWIVNKSGTEEEEEGGVWKRKTGWKNLSRVTKQK